MNKKSMIPVGYMLKHVASKPLWLKNDSIQSIYSVSGCISQDFCDYIPFWKHNGYWFFDSPAIMTELSRDQSIDTSETMLFYYEAYRFQYCEIESIWESFSPDKAFTTRIELPEKKVLQGFDIVSYSAGNAPECSYLSCNHMAEEFDVNPYCLMDSFEETKALIAQKVFQDCEPGPSRIIAVYTI